MNIIPERLIELRTALNITRAEAARMLNMSAMGYGRYEKGERTPSFQTVSYIARFFNTSTEYLYGLSDEKRPVSITISSDEDPDLYLLIEKIRTDKSIIPRLLAYADRLKISKKTETEQP